MPPVLDVSNKSYNDKIDYLYKFYETEIMDRNKRPKLFNKFIYIDCNLRIKRKTEKFWHLITLGQKELFEILPCNNDISSTLCNANCIHGKKQIITSDGEIRNICFYRAIRINWINEIIKLANKNDSNIKIWLKPGPDNKLHIRLQESITDYILIFKEKPKYYYFITAYPVFYRGAKINFDNDYLKYKI